MGHAARPVRSPPRPAGRGFRVVTINSRYRGERFEYLIGIMGHEFLRDDTSNSQPETAILCALTAMTSMQVLAKSPELAYQGTELARQLNSEVMLFINSREAGSPNSELYAPTGLGITPGSPNHTADFWSFFVEANPPGSSPGSETLRTILRHVLADGTPIPRSPTGIKRPPSCSRHLNDDWLSDVQRAQITVLLQLVTVDEIAQATGLGRQQVIDTLGLQPYLDAIN